MLAVIAFQCVSEKNDEGPKRMLSGLYVEAEGSVSIMVWFLQPSQMYTTCVYLLLGKENEK